MLDADQVDELKKMFPRVEQCSEGGYSFFLIPSYNLPSGCVPEVADLLLCPTDRDGYNSRLFFSELIQTAKPLNWNANSVRILERNWFAFSWRIAPNMRLAQIVAAHLGGFSNGAYQNP